jgi:hypothetical protein
MCLSKEHVANIMPNYGLAHLTFQTDAPWIFMLLYSIHPYVRFWNILMNLSLHAAAIRLPAQSKLKSWTMTLGAS